MGAVKNQAPFMYYGSKATLAPWIVSHFGEHYAYVEPFAGSAAVLMHKPYSRVEVLNDLDGNVINFWRVLRDNHEELIGLLQLTPYAREEWQAASEFDDGSVSDVERARRFFVRAMQGFNGRVAKNDRGYSQTVPRASAKPHGFRRRIDNRLADVAQRIRDVELECVDAIRLMDRWNDPSTLFYLDPPYVKQSLRDKSTYLLSDDGNLHGRLVDYLLTVRSQIVLSGYRSDVYRPLEDAGWRVVERKVNASTASKGFDSDLVRTEVLWINNVKWT
jgi:DNA adenine methylase